MALEPVAEHAGVFEVSSASLDSHGLARRNFDVLDECIRQKMFEDRIRVAQVVNIAHCFFAEVVVEQINLFWLEALGELLLDFQKTLHVVAHRLFQNAAELAIVLVDVRSAQVLEDRVNDFWWNGQIGQAHVVLPAFLQAIQQRTEHAEVFFFIVLALLVIHMIKKILEHLWIHFDHLFLNTLPYQMTELFVAHAGARVPDDVVLLG